ncbi:ABC transporter permease subunit [Pseudoalteromonas sp. JBTF-M23]|uniref:ABC transporter permease subunit n=1 Tax=Pseudoalteromonas caenipelagi TaxID=2726988 RepID=A0A849VFC8_9GAMM|nr:Gldg family protein [Pseudoalteromonas caenipelagi]NOU51458.1 ABC transporter permease subunit [Pseudoalteromonas caenipelagi]
MQPDNTSSAIFTVAKKELSWFFSSPIAYLFIGVFAAVTLFIFFWAEAFFARNIADIRPMFEWMPVLLIFLCSTITMRLWSEERRTGTIEYVHTLSVPLWHFVVGKFLGCFALLSVSLLITLPLPITVSLLGELDWGPVLSGYLAVLLLGSAYMAIGLAVSARSDNQIVSLLVACAVCGGFYFIGTTAITDFFSHSNAELLRQLGTGSRFEDITRGVIDVRDLYYYISLCVAFLVLNTYFLEQERWVLNKRTVHHKRWQALSVLLAINVLAANLWLGQLPKLRLDTTQGKQYSISDATQMYLAQLQEPLLIRGYFSDKTHPLLAPLVPQLTDLLEEYQVVADGRVRVEIIDPQQHPDLEAQANQQFGIKPVSFQVADRYQASVVSSYFNVVVQYGDEHQVLGFRDLIEVNARAESDVDVLLRNPEHDITQAIKAVLQDYQSAGNLFDTVQQPLTFTGYISSDEKLPEQLLTFKQALNEQLQQVQAKANGKFSINMVEPEANGALVAQRIAQEYGFEPMSTSLFANESFYFYLTLSGGEQVVQIPLEDMEASSFERNLNAAIKRFAKGFTKNVALVTPSKPGAYGMPQAQFRNLEQMLGAELNVHKEDLTDGQVSGEADILMLMAPESLDDKQLFAVDQFLMKGGTVVAATSPYSVDLSRGSLAMQNHQSGLNDWLAHHGLTIEDRLVMDPSNAAFPIPVTRNVGGFQLQEMRMLDYPYFVDVREGLNKDNLITSQLPQLTMAWASPISLDKERADIAYTPLIESSESAWTSSSLDIMPKLNAQGEASYLSEGDTSKHLLGVVAQGKFSSYFVNKENPLLVKQHTQQSADQEAESVSESQTQEAQTLDVSSVIKHSSDSARIILFSSNDFLQDQVLQLTGGVSQSDYLNGLQLMVNAVDWALEDTALMSIRSRGNFNRTLAPLDQSEQQVWEYGNYAFALLMLLAMALWAQAQRKRKQQQYLAWIAQ